MAVSVHDVAAYILEKLSPMTAMKLEKLVYYSKAWHLVWESESLFPERIEAWANGPVCPELFRHHRGQFNVSEWKMGSSSNLSDDQRESIDLIIDFFGEMTPYELSDLTHRERPWREARGDTPLGERSNNEITDLAMFEYYDSLVGSGQKN